MKEGSGRRRRGLVEGVSERRGDWYTMSKAEIGGC